MMPDHICSSSCFLNYDDYLRHTEAKGQQPLSMPALAPVPRRISDFVVGIGLEPQPRQPYPGQKTKVEIIARINALKAKRHQQIIYTLMKLESGDWHAVADGAMDLRDIDAEILGLEWASGV